MKDRKLYDLCRKYKYYYKAHEELRKLDEIYWNKHLRKAFNDSERQLKEVTDEIEYEMAKRMRLLNDGSCTINNNTEPIYSCDGKYVAIRRCKPKSVEITSDYFADKFSKLLHRYYKEKGWCK